MVALPARMRRPLVACVRQAFGVPLCDLCVLRFNWSPVDSQSEVVLSRRFAQEALGPNSKAVHRA